MWYNLIISYGWIWFDQVTIFLFVADVTSGDGIYSGWISNISTTSYTYSIHYTVTAIQGLAQVDNGKV